MRSAVAEQVDPGGREPPDGDRLLVVVHVAVDKAALNQSADCVEQPVVAPSEPSSKVGQDFPDAEWASSGVRGGIGNRSEPKAICLWKTRPLV